MKSFIIGIAGGSCSGKTTFTKKLKEVFGNEIAVISQDNYYKECGDVVVEERLKINHDHPGAFETELLIEHLNMLECGQTVESPVYDYITHNRSDRTIEIEPSKIIIVEGILVLYDEALRNLFDIKIFIDEDADVRILRRILRDTKERGDNMESIIENYLKTVTPMYRQYTEPTKIFADIVLNNSGSDAAFDIVKNEIEKLISN
ncbi:MAG: uridine kinase [Firmicutes bacterium]|nr:uridine kinase [Bacillota bacterium]